MTDQLLTLRQVAERLGVSPGQLRELARTGRLPANKQAGRWLVEAAALDSLALPGGRRQRARVAQGMVLEDMAHRLHGRGAIVSEPVRGKPRTRAMAAEAEALDHQLGVGGGDGLPAAGVARSRQAQQKNLANLEQRSQKPHTPERSI